MKTKLSPAAVGMFVLGAFALLVIGFLSFGGSHFFKQPSRFLVYFDESVSGLDPGAPIKFYGVRVGRVAAVNVRYDAATKSAQVQTVCEINRNVLTDPSGRTIDLNVPAELQKLIDGGLRARLSFTGITGLLFVELILENPQDYPVHPGHRDEPLPVIPAIPSPIAEVQQSVVEIVANLKKVDFAGLAKDLRAVLATANAKIAEADVKGLTERVGRAADAVQGFISSPEAQRTFANLNAAIADVRATLARIDGEVGPAGADLRRTLAEAQTALKSLTAAADSTRGFVDRQGQIGEEVTIALRQVAAAAESMERLADQLGRNPSSLLTGKRKPE